MVWSPEFRCVVGAGGERSWRVGHEVVDGFLEFAEGRARPNTVRAYAHDLKVFFEVVSKEPAEVTSADVLAFITVQRRPRAGAENVVRISDAGAGLSAATGTVTATPKVGKPVAAKATKPEFRRVRISALPMLQTPGTYSFVVISAIVRVRGRRS